MADETLISKLVDLIGDITELGGQRERTTIVPNILVVDATPSDLPTGYIKIRNPRDGTNVPCLTVNGLIVADNDLVNVLFTEGTEPIALTQGSQSPSSNIKVYQLWESDFGAVAWETNAGGDLANVDGETLTLNDSTPTNRILLNPATPLTAGTIRLSDETGQFRIIISSGTAAAASSVAVYDAAGILRFFVNSAGQLTGSDEATIQRINWATGTALTEATQTIRDETSLTRIQMASGLNAGDASITLDDGAGADKVILSSNGNILISDDLIHLGDTDTLRSFTDDAITDQAGGVIMLRMTETTQDLVEIGDVAGTGDVDVNINAGQVEILGSHGNVAIGVTPNTTNRLYVYRDTTSVARVRIENPNTGTGAFADIYILASKAAGGVHGYAIEMFGHNYTATWSGITLGNYAFFRSDSTVSGLIYTTGGNAPLIFGTNDVERMRISGNATRVAIGTNSPATSAVLDLTSTTGALLLPRMTTAQRNALTAVDGMIIFNSTTGKIEGREGGAWVDI